MGSSSRPSPVSLVPGAAPVVAFLSDAVLKVLPSLLVVRLPDEFSLMSCRGLFMAVPSASRPIPRGLFALSLTRTAPLASMTLLGSPASGPPKKL